MKQFIRRYSICIALIGVALVAAASTVTYAYVQVEQQIKQDQKRAAAEQKKTDAAIAVIKKERAAKEKAAKKAKADRDKKAHSQKETVVTQPATTLPPQASAQAHVHADPAHLDVIVNKQHPLRPRNYTPQTISMSCAGHGTAVIDRKAATDFTALCQAADKANEPLGVSSSYRSYATQVSTYNYWVSVSGQAGADTYSARPGYSEHQTGLAIDFRVPSGPELSDFTGSSQQKWLAKNAWKYGFIQRYTTANTAETGYTAESWHYRYIGRTLASQYTRSGASSLESFWGVSGGDY